MCLGWLVRLDPGPGDRVCDWAESRAAKELGFGARMSDCSLMPART